MSTALIAVYIAGFLLTVALILEVVPRVAPGQRIPRSKTHTFIAALIWPVLLVGLVQLGIIMAFFKLGAWVKRLRHKPDETQSRLANK